MALNNFDASIIGRSAKCKSHNVIKKAAYNNRERMTDERTGETWDYSSKDGLEWKGLFVPENAPDWMRDRKQLYAAIERREDESDNAHNAQLAHSWILALPHELTAKQREWLMTDFCREISRKGRVVDAAIHSPDKDGDDRNYHAHVMVTMRDITSEGFGNKIRAPGETRADFEKWKREELAAWKDRYSELGARQLERAGFEKEAARFRHGHKTLKEQHREALKRSDHEYARFLKDRQATQHMGPKATAMERDGIETRKGDKNREIERQNEERQRRKDWDRENVADLQKAMTTQQKRSLEEKVRGDGEHVYWAFRNAETPEAFAEDIKQRRLHLARITKEDAEHSKTLNFLQEKFNNKYRPIFNEGEYVVVNNKGWAYRLTMRSVEFTSTEVGRFMAPLNGNDIPSLRTVLRGVEARRIAGIDPRPYGSLPSDKLKRGARTAVRDTSRLASHGMRTGTRVLGKSLDAVTGLLESFLSPVLTPEQKWDARIANEERRERAEEATRRSRDDGGRDR